MPEVAPKAPMTPAELADDVLRGAGAPGGDLPADTPVADEDVVDDEPVADDEPPAQVAQVEEDDEKFLEANRGQSIPYPAFQKKYEKWKKRLADTEGKLKKELAEAIQKGQGSGSFNADQIARFQRIDSLFGTIDQKVKGKPFLEKLLVQLGQGKDPDLRELHSALAAHLENMPTVDPVVAQRIAEMEAWKEQVEFRDEVGSWERERDTQIGEIKRKYPDMDDGVISLARKMAAGIAANLPDNAPRSAYPKLTDIADELSAMISRGVEADRKKQVPRNGKTAPVGPTSAGAAPGAVKSKMPLSGTPEFAEWLQNPENLEALGR